MTAFATVIPAAGVVASRPAANSVPIGTLYSGTDTGLVYRSNGTTWDTWATITGSSPLTTKGDVYTYSTTNARLPVGSNGQVLTADSAQTTGIKWAAAASAIGSSSLVYRYTVAGSDKASIDTGVDTPDAGSNDWTNGDLLEVCMLVRTDDAGAQINVDVTVNNDTGSNYDFQQNYGSSTTAGASASNAQAKWSLTAHGTGGTASYPAVLWFAIPAFSGTTFNKVAYQGGGPSDGTAANQLSAVRTLGWRSTSAITRLKLAAQSTAKLKVGSELLIYKRLAS